MIAFHYYLLLRYYHFRRRESILLSSATGNPMWYVTCGYLAEVSAFIVLVLAAYVFSSSGVAGRIRRGRFRQTLRPLQTDFLDSLSFTAVGGIFNTSVISSIRSSSPPFHIKKTLNAASPEMILEIREIYFPQRLLRGVTKKNLFVVFYEYKNVLLLPVKKIL